MDDMTHIAGRLAFFQMSRSENWFHWLLQVLPRVKQLADSGKKFDALHAPRMGRPHRESLRCALTALGIDVQVYEDADITADRTIEAPHYAWEPSTGLPPPRWLIEFLRSLVPLDDASGPKSIFVSRRGYKDHDEARGVEHLLGLVVPVVYPAEMSFAEQVRMFASADLIIAPHGSGLTNVVFCKPHTKIVEVVPPEYHTNVFALLSYAASCFYTRIEAVSGKGR
jgi:capsular polysaccharide biosynthesis protein